MPVFVYKAKKENAQTVTGEVTARDADEAVDLIGRLGLLPIVVEEKGSSSSLGTASSRPIKTRHIRAFTRQLVRLLKSGVPLLRSLEILARQTHDVHFSGIIEDLAANLRNGRSFSSSLADYPQAFTDIYVTLVRAGEESGRLKELLSSLMIYQGKQEEISQKVRGALVYPAVMLFVGIGTVLFILSFVMPKISLLFEGMHTALPWPTQVVIGLSHGIRFAWPALVVLLFLGIIAARSLAQMPSWRRKVNDLITTFPLIRTFVVKTDLERFSRTMGLLMESGIPILKALEIAVPTLDYAPLRAQLSLCHQRVSGGDSFGECLRDSGFIPDIVVQLISVGEESGELSGALKDIADTCEQEIAEATRTMTTLLEPLLILAVGLVVGFVVFAMLMPIFQMDAFA
ncbi:MAG: type II secretion system F family protein [Candidatus Omnitrophica bacterium]|nr:type II secretion system F family protein [Candidatus Omnitrophota bacterium]